MELEITLEKAGLILIAEYRTGRQLCGACNYESDTRIGYQLKLNEDSPILNITDLLVHAITKHNAIDSYSRRYPVINGDWGVLQTQNLIIRPDELRYIRSLL